MLWFDVGYKRYTTDSNHQTKHHLLWFDVGYKRYTTQVLQLSIINSCGLMQDTKDIQRMMCYTHIHFRCGLMQDTKDIQPSLQ